MELMTNVLLSGFFLKIKLIQVKIYKCSCSVGIDAVITPAAVTIVYIYLCECAFIFNSFTIVSNTAVSTFVCTFEQDIPLENPFPYILCCGLILSSIFIML